MKRNVDRGVRNLLASSFGGILERTKIAMKFIGAMTADRMEELKDPLVWRKYEELSYVFVMNELF